MNRKSWIGGGEWVHLRVKTAWLCPGFCSYRKPLVGTRWIVSLLLLLK